VERFLGGSARLASGASLTATASVTHDDVWRVSLATVWGENTRKRTIEPMTESILQPKHFVSAAVLLAMAACRGKDAGDSGRPDASPACAGGSTSCGSTATSSGSPVAGAGGSPTTGSGGSNPGGSCPTSPPVNGSACTPPWMGGTFITPPSAHCTWGGDPRPL